LDYDAFISYRSTDRAWAVKLAADLRAKQFKIFLDDQRIAPGTDWRDGLAEALERSQHLIVLWSGVAAQSEWVTTEIAQFMRIAEKERGTLGRESRIINVALEGSNKVLARYQEIPGLRDTGAYQDGPDQVDADLWQSILTEIEESMRAVDDRTPIALGLVATTRPGLEKLDFSQAPAGVSLESVLGHFNIAGKKQLLASYGDTRQDWRPFGSQARIGTILTQLRDEINAFVAKLNGRMFRWDDVTDDIWSTDEERIRSGLAKLARGPAVLVVDPIALYDPAIANRLTNRLNDALENDSGFLCVLTPFEAAAAACHLRDLIRQVAYRVFEGYYEPPLLKGRPHVHCGPSVGDDIDFKAWMMAAIGPHVAASNIRSSSAVLRLGG